jgi:hypothetical protein
VARGPGRLLPSDSALVLKYGSGSSSDFLAKILSVDTPPFLWKTQFYFPLSSLLLHILVKCSIFISSAPAQVLECLRMVWQTHIPFPHRSFFFLAVEAIKFHLFLRLCTYLFSFFLYSRSKTTGMQLVS